MQKGEKRNEGRSGGRKLKITRKRGRRRTGHKLGEMGEEENKLEQSCAKLRLSYI